MKKSFKSPGALAKEGKDKYPCISALTEKESAEDNRIVCGLGFVVVLF